MRLFLRSLRNDKVGNLEYALSLEPSSNLLKDRLDAAKAKRAEGLPTVPSTLLEAPAAVARAARGGMCRLHVRWVLAFAGARAQSLLPCLELRGCR